MDIITKNHIVEFAALLVSIIFYNSLKDGKLKTLPFFLAFILSVELIGSYLIRGLGENNVWVYNVSILIEYLYYLYLIQIHGGKLVRVFVFIAYAAFIGVSAYYFATKSIFEFHTNKLITGQLLVILACCLYIYELFNRDYEESLFKNYFFWIFSGLFLFNLGEVVYFILLPVIKENNWDKFDIFFMSINSTLILLLYVSYIIAIFVLKRRYGKNA